MAWDGWPPRTLAWLNKQYYLLLYKYITYTLKPLVCVARKHELSKNDKVTVACSHLRMWNIGGRQMHSSAAFHRPVHSFGARQCRSRSFSSIPWTCWCMGVISAPPSMMPPPPQRRAQVQVPIWLEQRRHGLAPIFTFLGQEHHPLWWVTTGGGWRYLICRAQHW